MRVAGHSLDERVVQPAGGAAEASIGGHLRTNLSEGGYHQPRRHTEPTEVPSEPAQAVDDRLWLEHAVRDGKCHEGVGIQVDVQLLSQRPCQRRVQVRLTFQLEFEVATVSANRQRTQQHRGAEVFAVEFPFGHADGQMNRFDAARRTQLDALLGNLVGGQLGVAQRQIVTDEVRQQRGVASDELRHTAGVGAG